MARRIVAGILGGVVGVLPLVLVNLLVNAGGALGGLETVAAENAAALGIMALLGGVLVGGMLAGWLAGCTRLTRALLLRPPSSTVWLSETASYVPCPHSRASSARLLLPGRPWCRTRSCDTH